MEQMKVLASDGSDPLDPEHPIDTERQPTPRDSEGATVAAWVRAIVLLVSEARGVEDQTPVHRLAMQSVLSGPSIAAQIIMELAAELVETRRSQARAVERAEHLRGRVTELEGAHDDE